MSVVTVREALSEEGGVEELAELLEVRAFLTPGGLKVGLILKGVPSVARVWLRENGAERELVHLRRTRPDSELQYGFVGDLPLVEGGDLPDLERLVP